MTDWAQYALPLSPRGPAGLAPAAGHYFREVSRDFLIAHHDTLCEMVPGGEAVWERWFCARSGWAVDWHRSLGALARDCANCDGTEIARRWVEFLLHLGDRGVAGKWHVRFERPVVLQFRRGLLEDVVAIRVYGRPGGTNSIAIETRLSPGHPGRKTCTPAWDCVSHRPRVSWRGLALPFLSMSDIARLEGVPESRSAPPVEIVEEDALWNFAAAAQMLDDHAWGYARWVRRVVRHIVALPTSSGRTLSSSDARAPGVVRLSLAHDPATIAELLVHEASHAYFHLLEQTGPVDDGSDRKLYYSPFKRANRPVGVILLTYHAFANVVLLYRTLLQSRAPLARRHVAGEVRDTLRKLEPLESALSSTRALTPRGMAVWNALKERLDETAGRRRHSAS